MSNTMSLSINGKEIFEKGGVYFPDSAQIEHVIPLECCVWIFAEWQSAIKKSQKDIGVITMLSLNDLAQKKTCRIAKHTLGAILISEKENATFLMFGLYDSDLVEEEKAKDIVLGAFIDLLIERERYEVLEQLINHKKD